MKQILTAARTVCIHDFDGVHYNYKLIPDYKAFFLRARAEAACMVFKGLPIEDAQILSAESAKLDYSLEPFKPEALKRGMNPDTALMDLHATVHKRTFDMVVAEHPHILEPNTRIIASHERLKGVVRHGLLTQGCAQNWSIPFMGHKGTLQYYDSNALIGHADLNGLLKAKDPEAIRLMLSLMRAQAHETTFTEDTLINLEVAKRAEPLILTVHFHHDSPLQELPPYVDMQTRDMESYMAKLEAVHLPPYNNTYNGAALRARQFVRS